MKRFTFVMILMLAAGFAFGQISLGPKIGYNTSKLTVDASDISSDLKSSFNFGVFLRVGKKIYLQPEINWMTRGGVFKSPSQSSVSPINQEIDLKTIEIPVLVGWRIINLGVGNIRVMAGPSGSIVVDKTIETNDVDKPIKDSDINDMIWGFNVGAGVDVLMFTLDVRYQMGLNEIIGKVENFDFNSKNNVFCVSLGWKIL
ncbi:MAG: PorT family protein [Clostridia bacterium]|nr:PorT family protein [Clostridia bacterium]